jgi:hypothetical protein
MKRRTTNDAFGNDTTHNCIRTKIESRIIGITTKKEMYL